MKQIKEVLDKSNSLKLLKQSQSKKVRISALLNELGTITTEGKVVVKRCARFYKHLHAISREVAETN